MQDHISQSMGQRHDRLLGNYRILRMIGQGSFADVYLGEHIHLHTQAAIKVLQVRLVESNIQSFLNEARTIAHLVHPYIVRVLDFGVEANTPFLVMDYAPQGTFRQRFLQGKPLPPTALVPFIKQAASALQYAHDKKLIHRDVKPENMLLGPNEEILLSDFGFAVIQTSLTRPSIETAGTASYMAPEQFQGKPQPASDQYSLGVIAYEWLTGTCPFQGTFMELASQHIMTQPPSLIQRVPGLSAQIAQVVMTALAKEPEERFPSVLDFARALEHACLNSNNRLAASEPIMPPPFLFTPPDSQTIYMSPTNSGDSLARPNQNPQPILNSEPEQPEEAQTYFQPTQPSPILQSSSNAFPPALTAGSYPSIQAPSSSFETFRQEPTPSLPSSTFPAFPQSVPNPFEPAQSSFWQNSPTPTTASTRQTALNMLNATEHLSQSGLPPLPQLMNQERSELTNAQKPSSVKPSEQSLSFTPYPSQAHLPALPELPHLPQQPFLGPELAGQDSPASMAPQMFPPSQNVSIRTRALSHNVPPPDADSAPLLDLLDLDQPLPALPTSNSQTPQLVRAEDFRKTTKSSTSGALNLFIISMILLIIGSTTFLVLLTNNQHHGKSATANRPQSTPHTRATATTAPQQTTPTTEPTTTEPNPYGNHNGILVLNDPLNQQNPQRNWDASSGACSFSTDGYHVVANAQSQGFTLCSTATSDYTNFAYQVQMTFTKVTGTAASGGLVFRGNKASKQFYFFEIFTNGAFDLYRCPGPNGAACPLLSVTTGGPIPSFHANLNQPNTIAVLANGNEFSLYVNNQLAVGPIVDTTADSTYTHGTIGMMARESGANAETDVVFNNIKIWKM